MPCVHHVNPYLMCAPRFQHAFHHRHISKFLDYFVVGYGMLAYFPVGREYGHLQPVFRVACDIPGYRAAVGVGDAPHKCDIFALGCFVEELFAKVGLGIGCFGYDKQP